MRMRTSCLGRGARSHFRGDHEHAVTLGSRTGEHRLVAELIQNAAVFSPPETITITLTAEGKNAALVVDGTGPGFS